MGSQNIPTPGSVMDLFDKVTFNGRHVLGRIDHNSGSVTMAVVNMTGEHCPYMTLQQDWRSYPAALAFAPRWFEYRSLQGGAL